MVDGEELVLVVLAGQFAFPEQCAGVWVDPNGVFFDVCEDDVASVVVDGNRRAVCACYVGSGCTPDFGAALLVEGDDQCVGGSWDED